MPRKRTRRARRAGRSRGAGTVGSRSMAPPGEVLLAWVRGEFTDDGTDIALTNKAGDIDLTVGDVNCASLNGSEELLIPELDGTETVTSSLGTSTPTVAAGKITFTAGTCGWILLDNGSLYPLEDGTAARQSPMCHDVVNGFHGTWDVGTSDLATIWAGTRAGRSFNILKGFRLLADRYVPAHIQAYSEV